MTANETAELISLALTSPTLISSFIVVAMFWRPAQRAIFTKEKRTSYQWLIIGVAVSFLGGFLDNAYWGSAWGRLFLHHESWELWFKHGVFSNIPARQLAGMVAAYCHVKSVWESDKDDHITKKMLVFNCVMITATVTSLIFWILAKN